MMAWKFPSKPTLIGVAKFIYKQLFYGTIHTLSGFTRCTYIVAGTMLLSAARRSDFMKARLLTQTLCFTLMACSAFLVCAKNNKNSTYVARKNMIESCVIQRGITNPAIVQAMLKVPRELFVSEDEKENAYKDMPISIGEGLTMPPPYIVALTTNLLQLTQEDTVLEIGTGSGYQAAVMAHIAQQVYTIDFQSSIIDAARGRFDSLGYKNIALTSGDGSLGWPEHAPYDAIIVTGAADEIFPALIEQLKEGGRLVIPVGTNPPQLKLVIKKDGNIEIKNLIPVDFAPIIKQKSDDENKQTPLAKKPISKEKDTNTPDAINE